MNQSFASYKEIYDNDKSHDDIHVVQNLNDKLAGIIRDIDESLIGFDAASSLLQDKAREKGINPVILGTLLGAMRETTTKMHVTEFDKYRKLYDIEITEDMELRYVPDDSQRQRQQE